MIDRFRAKHYESYMDSQLPILKSAINIPPPPQITALQNRACSSLCELSANICLEQQTERNHQEILAETKYRMQYSPWKVKKKSFTIDEKEMPIKKRKKNTTKYISSEYWNEDYRCLTQNKENASNDKKPLNQIDKKKNNSIFFRIIGLNQAKGTVNLKSQHPDIEMVACLNKKKYSLIETSKCCTQNTKNDRGDVAVQVNRQITPKLVSIQDRKAQGFIVSKKMQSSLLCNWSQDVRDANTHGQHWKAKNRNQKNNRIINRIPTKDLKSLEARDVRQTCLRIKRGSASYDKARRDQYHSNNPLTRLLYEKYLSTIGIKQPSKEKLRKFL